MAETWTLEGLESSWDSPGLGKRRVWWKTLPAVGERFTCFHSGSRYLCTTPVQSVREFPDGSIGFKTERTTYILRRDDDNASGVE